MLNLTDQELSEVAILQRLWRATHTRDQQGGHAEPMGTQRQCSWKWLWISMLPMDVPMLFVIVVKLWKEVLLQWLCSNRGTNLLLPHPNLIATPSPLLRG